MRFNWLTGWLGGGGKSEGPSRRARLAVLPAVLFVAAGLATATDPPPTAPPPREAKPASDEPQAKLLVGRWDLAGINGVLPKGSAAEIEFATDGKVTIRASGGRRVADGSDRPTTQGGSYRLEGRQLHFKTILDATGQKRAWTVAVERLTEGELVFKELTDSKDRMRFERRRK